MSREQVVEDLRQSLLVALSDRKTMCFGHCEGDISYV